jgi:hypothetical protein
MTLSLGDMTQTVEVQAGASSPSASVPHRAREAGIGSGSGIGRGVSAGSGGGIGAATYIPPPPLDLYGKLQHLESATGRDLAGLFEYKVAQPVTIAQNQSALVPILNTNIDAEHVTLWSAQEQVPMRAIWLKNTSGQTLDGGSFSILNNNAFAGEGIFDVIHPKERRLLSYAVDGAVRISRDGERERKPLKHLRIAKGVMIETTEEREDVTYTVRNTDGHARSVIIEHPKYDGWKLVSETQPEETTSALQRFRVKVAANDESTLKVEQVHPLRTTVTLNDVTPDRIIMLLKYKGAQQELAPQLQRILGQRSAVADIDRRISDLLTEETDIGKDQQRLRDNMKALKGSAEERALLHRYTTELNTQEDRLAELKRQQLKESINRQKAQSLLSDTISNTTFDGDL